MNIPKKWRGAEGNLHHLVNVIEDAGEQVIISKTWRSRFHLWRYHAQTVAEFETVKKFNKHWGVKV